MKHHLQSVSVHLFLLFLLAGAGKYALAQESNFRICFNTLTTNFNYGASNSALRSAKKNLTGLQVGASYQVGLTRSFSIVPEVYFALRGGKLDENAITRESSTVKLYTLEAPVLARWQIRNWYVNAGPYAAYALGGRIKTRDAVSKEEHTGSISFGNAPDAFKRWDLGLQAGLGYRLQMKRRTLNFDARYGYGLLNLSNDLERYNRTFTLSIQVSPLH
jgi:hypothetical protein